MTRTPAETPAATSAEPVIVYSKPGCVQCHATYRALAKEGIGYQVRDVSQDAAARARAVELGYQQLPVLEAGTEHWGGFRPDLIAALSG